jgi:hypothetical protein
MGKRFEWELEIGDKLKRYMKKMELPKPEEELPLLPKDNFEFDRLKLKSPYALDPLGSRSFQLKEPLDWKEQHRDFVIRHKAEMEQDMKMIEQRESDAKQKQMEDMKLKQDSQRFLKNHFDNIERTMGPMIEPLVHKFKP